MSSHCPRRLLVLCLLLVAFPFANAAPPAPKPTTKQIAQWIEQLGDNSFAVREQASKKLWAAGSAAESALETAIKSDDAEVVRRARDILDKFRWGIYPDTPAEIVARIQAYRSTDANQRLEIVQKLLQAGPAGLQAVVKISKAEKDPNQRKMLGQLVSSKLPTAFAGVLETNDYAPFEALLELGHDSAVIDNNQYVAYWLLRGKLEERIAHFRALLAKTPTEKRLAETLAYLYRAKGDLTEARKAAEKTERGDLVEGILYEAADWKALAARPDLAGKDRTVEKWAYRATFARLAGNQKDFETFLADLRTLAEKGLERENQFEIVEAFLLNDRQADGLALLRKMPNRRGTLFEILCARLEYQKARELVEWPQRDEEKLPDGLALEWARVLSLLGEKQKAEALFAAAGKHIKDGVNDYWAARLLREEYRAGLKELAFEHCGKLLSVAVKKTVASADGGSWESLFLSDLFPKQSTTAEMWWVVLRWKFKDESSALTLKRLRQVMEGKVAAKEVKAWIAEAEPFLSQPTTRISATRLPVYQQALAEAAAKAGLDDRAYSLLEKAGTTASLIRLGDLLVGKKQWTKAAERYRQAWRKSLADLPLQETDRSNPLPLYLAGEALLKAGQEKEGKKLIEQSHWVLLADAGGRFTFLRALVERGHAEAAQRETELLLRVSEPNSYYSNEAMRRLAVAAAARGDYAKAAEGFEQSMLRCLDRSTFFLHSGAYAVVPAQVHQMRASALLAAGKIDEANKHIELALASSPGSVELPIALIPALDKRDHKKEATALFERSVAVHEKVCRDYPRCAWAHNSVAWLSACCRRNLDKALEHADKAVSLTPTNAGYLDTLAEVHFQRGEKDKAIALQKRAIEIDPKKSYYRKQLRRLEAGDPSAERPPEDDN